MANPQPDNFTRISNELMEAFGKINLSSYEFRVLIIILRKTYGYQKKADWISFSQFRELTNLPDSHISRTLKILLQRKILTKGGKSIGLNKDYEQWGDLPKGVNTHHLPKGVSVLTKGGKKNLPKGADTKESKETITKEIIPTVLVASPPGKRNPELNELVGYADQLHFVLQGNLVENRRSAYNCLKKYGLEASQRLVLAAVNARGKPYSPTINDFTALYRKAGDLATYYAKNNKGKVINYDE